MCSGFEAKGSDLTACLLLSVKDDELIKLVQINLMKKCMLYVL